MSTDQVVTARTAPRLSTKALKLVVASKSPRSAKKSPRDTKRTDAKTKKKDYIPALAGNFQDRDEIELKISYRDVVKESKKQQSGRKKRNIKSGKRIVVYSTSTANRGEETDRSEGRDEADSPRLPSGCT
jgi:hypothetical protein